MELDTIIKKYDMSLLLTFGSYNTDRYTKDSDIDLAYISKRALTVEEKINMLEDMVNYFRRDGIDLIDLSKVEPVLGYEVASNANILYEENESFLKFRLKAAARYADTKRLRELRKKYLFEHAGLM